jgi:hypothetical protein
VDGNRGGGKKIMETEKLKQGVLIKCALPARYPGEYFWSRVPFYEELLPRIAKAMREGRYYSRIVDDTDYASSTGLKLGFVEKNALHGIHDPAILKLAGINNDRMQGGGFCAQHEAQHNLYRAITGEDGRGILPQFGKLV